VKKGRPVSGPLFRSRCVCSGPPLAPAPLRGSSAIPPIGGVGRQVPKAWKDGEQRGKGHWAWPPGGRQVWSLPYRFPLSDLRLPGRAVASLSSRLLWYSPHRVSRPKKDPKKADGVRQDPRQYLQVFSSRLLRQSHTGYPGRKETRKRLMGSDRTPGNIFRSSLHAYCGNPHTEYPGRKETRKGVWGPVSRKRQGERMWDTP
jgi:hypothetical protein